jgi:nucleotide-binding universal stress UspA family protein
MQILCPTDFSIQAMAASDVAAVMALKLNLPLRLLHCAQDFIVMGELPVVMPDDTPFIDQFKHEAARLRTSNVEVIEELRHGSASYETIIAASEHPTLMIILGSFGKGRAERWLIGSVAERVAEGAPVPTLVVRQPELLQAWLNRRETMRLLCGVDFTASADAAILAMKTFITLGQVEIEAAYVCPAEEMAYTKMQPSSKQRDVWERVHGLLGDTPVNVHVSDSDGQPVIEFLNTANEQKSGLLVVGTHQRHGLQRLKAPSFSRSLLTHASTNVLCVPATTASLNTGIPFIRRVLVATDFAEICTDALRQAHRLIPSGGAIKLVHVCPEPTHGINPIIASEVYFDHSLATAKAKKDAIEKMSNIPLSLLTLPGVNTTTEVIIHHDVAAAICEAAERMGADVICMGTTGHSRTGVAVHGSTVQAVLARSHRPVFVVTPPLA